MGANKKALRSTGDVSPKAMVPRHKGLTFGDLPGELRNEIYRLVFDVPSQELVPHQSSDQQRRKNIINLLRASSYVFHEARGLMENELFAHIPVLSLLTYGTAAIPDSRAGTITRALEVFMNVHFHLHLEHEKFTHTTPKESVADMLSQLHHVLRIFMAHSQMASRKHQWRRRKAIIHLDDLVVEWTSRDRYIVGSYRRLVELISWDVNTDWEIRFSVETVRPEDDPARLLHASVDLAYFKALCREYDHIHVKAEVSGKLCWSEENQTAFTTRELLPNASPVWGEMTTGVPLPESMLRDKEISIPSHGRRIILPATHDFAEDKEAKIQEVVEEARRQVEKQIERRDERHEEGGNIGGVEEEVSGSGLQL